MKVNYKYQILTPNGFEDFDGINKVRKVSIEIYFDNGISLRGSKNHQIYDIDGNPYFLGIFKKGNKIKSPDGFLTVTKVKKFYYPTNLYDIVNSGKDHLYISNGNISHNCDFLGSGDNVVPAEQIKNQEITNVRIPKDVLGFDGNLYVWEDPIEGHQYILGSDISGGQSDDFSTIVIYDVDTGHQVLEWQGKLPPDIVGEVINEWGRKYQALAVVDITGGMGQGTVKKLLDLEYPKIHYTSAKDNKIIMERFAKWRKQDDLVPGFVIGAKNRPGIILAIQIAIRESQIAIRSQRLIEEFNTFIWINGRADHKKGFHDDLIFATGLVLYVLQHSFQNLEKYKAQTIAMLNAWDVVSSVRPSMHSGERNDIQTNMNSNNSWLFSGLKGF